MATLLLIEGNSPATIPAQAASVRGIRVLHARNLDAGIGILETNAFDIVVVDLDQDEPPVQVLSRVQDAAGTARLFGISSTSAQTILGVTVFLKGHPPPWDALVGDAATGGPYEPLDDMTDHGTLTSQPVRENRARLIHLEKRMQQIERESSATVAKLDGIGKQLDNHMQASQSQAAHLDTGLRDLKDAIEADRRFERDQLAQAAGHKAKLTELAQAEETAHAEGAASKWAAIRSAASPETLRTVAMILTIVGALFGKVTLDRSQQAELIRQIRVEASQAVRPHEEAPSAEP